MATIVTVNDVQHWTACRSVLLHADTVITPSAKQWLAEHQVAIQRATETSKEPNPLLSQQVEPTPDQTVPHAPSSYARSAESAGRDADHSQASEDPLFEAGIAMAHSSKGYIERAIITVLGKDRIGITARITALLSQAQVNILDINQTLFGDLFSMNMAVDIVAANLSFAELKAALAAIGAEWQLQVLIQRQAVFDYMHRM